jgi:hypothetical protein
VRAVDQWSEIEMSLGSDWELVRLSFVPEDAGGIGPAAAVLAPLGPGRSAGALRFQVTRAGAGPERFENLLRRLDRKRVWGELTLVDAQVAAPLERAEAEAEAEHARQRGRLVEQWGEAIAELPPGRRDLLVELELDSTDFLAQAALAGAPLNPSRVPGEVALRFRVSERGGGGYGASAGMARRCLERMDEQRITGELHIVGALSDVDNVYTQGPIWRVAGRSV